MKNLLLILFIIPFIALKGQYVSGKVTDKNRNPIAGVTVYTLGSRWNKTVYTNKNGEYNIEYNIDHKKLCFNLDGYIKKEINLRINRDTTIDVVLEQKPTVLKQIEIDAYLRPGKPDITFATPEDTIVYKGYKPEILKIEKKWTANPKDADWKEKFLSNFDYPDSLIYKGVDGVVKAQFELDENGNIKDFLIKKSYDTLLNKPVSDAILNFTDWKAVVLTDKMLKKAKNPDEYGSQFWIIPEKTIILPVNYKIIRVKKE